MTFPTSFTGSGWTATWSISALISKTGEEDLDTAQEQKLEHICRKLRLQPGERLLDIGCGWGGLLCWAASRYGIEGIGITLSDQQFAYARERVAAMGLERKVEIHRRDYREVPDQVHYDKIVSMGMYEHVSLANLPAYFGAIARLLRPGGIALNHGITTTDRDGHAQGPPDGEFIDRLVFPGSEVPHVSRVLYEIAGTGLELLDIEDLRPHYPPTLLHWARRLETQRDKAVMAAGAQAIASGGCSGCTCRLWRMPSIGAGSRCISSSRKRTGRTDWRPGGGPAPINMCRLNRCG